MAAWVELLWRERAGATQGDAGGSLTPALLLPVPFFVLPDLVMHELFKETRVLSNQC